MIGQFLALLSGVGFAGASVFMRQAVFRTGETATSVFFSIFFGTVIFLLTLVLSGDVGQLTAASWQAVAALAGAGVIHFILGRWLHYYSLQLIGANRGGPLLSSSTLVAVILGIMIMDEPFTWGLALGVAFIVIGVTLVSTESGSDSASDIVTTKGDMIKGVATGLAAGICFGISPVLIKIAIEEDNSPYTAIFISYLTALLLLFVQRLISHRLGELILFSKKALVPMSLGATATTIAQICRYVSLDYISVSVASPLNSTSNLFIIPLSFLVNRRIELFTWKIIVGAISVVLGIYLVFQV